MSRDISTSRLRESNPHRWLRRPISCPLDQAGRRDPAARPSCCTAGRVGSNGDRSRNRTGVLRFAGGSLTSRACGLGWMMSLPAQSRTGAAGLRRPGGRSAAREMGCRRGVGRPRDGISEWARQESNLHSRSYRVTAGFSRRVSSPSGAWRVPPPLIPGSRPGPSLLGSGTSTQWRCCPSCLSGVGGALC